MLLVFQQLLIAEHLSVRLLILESVFLVSGVWPQLPSYFSNAMKGVACVQTSVLLRNAIKISCLQKLCIYVSLSLSAVVALVVSLSQRQNGKIVMQARAKRLVRNGSEDRVRKCSHNSVKSASRTMSTREGSSG